MREKRLRVFTIAVGICIILVFPTFVQADGGWSEDFSPPDPGERWTWPDDWPDPVFDDGRIRGQAWNNISHTYVWRPSNVSVGSWSFDVQYVGGWNSTVGQRGLLVAFMSSEPFADLWDHYVLRVYLAPTGGHFSSALWRVTEDTITTVSSYEFPELSNFRGTHHFNISRDVAGHLSVLLNGTEVMQGTDAEITTSSHFLISFHCDFAVDNIVVADTFDDEAGIPWWLLVIVIGGAAVAVIMVVVILKRR
ncbi:MAG: hypothetical protein ACXADO_05510 [Candidatus Thorarchaeota archaeon]